MYFVLSIFFVYLQYISVNWHACTGMTLVFKKQQQFSYESWYFESWIWIVFGLQTISDYTAILGPLLLTWFNFNPSMDK